MNAATWEKPKYSLFNMNARAEDVVKEVEEWSATHPRKTRQSVFLEQYPETILDEYGVITICPATLSPAHRSSNGVCNRIDDKCPLCRREFWMKEVE